MFLTSYFTEKARGMEQTPRTVGALPSCWSSRTALSDKGFWFWVVLCGGLSWTWWFLWVHSYEDVLWFFNFVMPLCYTNVLYLPPALFPRWKEQLSKDGPLSDLAPCLLSYEQLKGAEVWRKVQHFAGQCSHWLGASKDSCWKKMASVLKNWSSAFWKNDSFCMIFQNHPINNVNSIMDYYSW